MVDQKAPTAGSAEEDSFDVESNLGLMLEVSVESKGAWPTAQSEVAYWALDRGRIIASAANWPNATVQTVCFQTVPVGGYSPVGGFVLEVAYTDAGGDDEVTAKIHVQVSRGSECRVHRIDYFRGDSPEPFVSTRVGLPG
jgi:hypothetical protein